MAVSLLHLILLQRSFTIVKALVLLLSLSLIFSCETDAEDNASDDTLEDEPVVVMRGVFHGFFNGPPLPHVCCGNTPTGNHDVCDFTTTDIATYRSLEQCQTDAAWVRNNSNAQTNIWAIGPNAIEAGGNNGGSNDTDCNLENYNGPNPPNDNNIFAICATAFFYDCTGNEPARIETCNLYSQLEASWVGPDPFPVCPYCD